MPISRMVGMSRDGKNSAINLANYVGTLYTTSTTVTVPNNATKAIIICVGGGGSGSVSNSTAYGGIGGGGGACAIGVISVTAGESLDFVVGLGGVTTATGASAGVAGGESYVSRAGTKLIGAAGGGGGPTVTAVGQSAVSRGLAAAQPTLIPPGGFGYAGAVSTSLTTASVGTGGGGAAGWDASGNTSFTSSGMDGSSQQGGGGNGLVYVSGATNDGSVRSGSGGASSSLGGADQGTKGGNGGLYGGGGGGSDDVAAEQAGNGADGAIRVIWKTAADIVALTPLKNPTTV